MKNQTQNTIVENQTIIFDPRHAVSTAGRHRRIAHGNRSRHQRTRRPERRRSHGPGRIQVWRHMRILLRAGSLREAVARFRAAFAVDIAHPAWLCFRRQAAPSILNL